MSAYKEFLASIEEKAWDDITVGSFVMLHEEGPKKAGVLVRKESPTTCSLITLSSNQTWSAHPVPIEAIGPISPHFSCYIVPILQVPG